MALDLLRGASYPFRAAGLVLRVPRLRRLAALCAAVTLLIFAGWAWALWAFLPRLLEAVWRHPQGAVGWLWELTLIVSGALAWLLGAATLPLLALAPLEDTLVAATESAVGAPPAPPSGIARAARQAVSAVARTAIRVMLLLVGQALLLVLQLLVPAGAPVWAIAGVGLDRALRLRRVPRPTAGPARGHLCRGAAGACEAHRARAWGSGWCSTVSCGSRS